MADTEEYFPRGGKKPTTTYFKQSENFLGAAEKGERKKKKIKRKSENDDGYLSDEVQTEDDQSFKSCSIWLNYKVVKEGLLLLGRIRQVLETKIYIALPCRMSGVVMACHISEAYNKILEAYVNDQTDTVKELPQMFRPGQYVAVKVLEVAEQNLMLSMMPQHINSSRMLGDLHKGALLQAAVLSVEDHGYVMDIGIPNTRTFLPKDSANPEIELDIGMLTWVTIKSNPSVDSSVIKLSNILTDLQRGVQKSKTNTLFPGTALDFTVDKPLDNGIEGHILDNTTAYIQRHQADLVKGKKPALGQKIRARLLYVVPPKNTPYLTMKSIFASTLPDLSVEQKLKDGDIIEEAKVLKIAGRSIHMKLGEGSIGILSLRRVAVHEDLTDEQVLAKSYPIGSTHKVRVLCYNLSDYVYSLSDDAAILNEKYFNLSQLNIGDIVPATVTSVADNHLRVNVGRVSGYVPQSHMTDTGVFIDPKKATHSKLPKKKFKVGQEVKARVLAIDLTKHQLTLSLKPTLLEEDLEVLKSYKEAQVGKMYTGVVAHIRDYLIVSFFNNVTAYVPRRLVTTEPIDSLTHAFHQGQIVKCTIMSVNAETKKMSGSLITKTFTPIENLKKPTKRKGKDKESAPPSKKQKTDIKKKEAKKDNENSEMDVDESEINENSNKKQKQKRNKKDQSENIDIDKTEEIETKKAKKKEKKNKDKLNKEDSSNEIDTKEDIETNEQNKSKKNKKKKIEEKSDVQEEQKEIKKSYKKDITNEINTEEDVESNEQNKSKKNKKKKKEEKSDVQVEIKEQKETKEASEESDAIETDIHEDSDQILTPQDLNLIDLSDCDTAKSYKKRVVSLIKAIKARTNRLNRVEKKIEAIEQKGLNAANKKYHTAMNMERLVIEERIKKLMETLTIAQDKFKQLDVESNKDLKKKKKLQLPAKIISKFETKKDLEDNEDEEKSKRKKRNNKEVSGKDSKDEENKEKTEKIRKVKVLEVLKPIVEVPSAKDFWSLSAEDVNNTREEESSSSEEEEEEKPKKKRKKLSIAEKAAKAREEEERIREMEKRAIESENAPRSSDHFERALLSEPNCSQLWIAYMAFHLQATEMEKARAVGRKALNIINFREEAEKLNVWLALLSLEHRFGTKESQQKTLEDALQMNDTYQVHSKLLEILVDTSKHQELVALVELMMRKYRKDLDVYIRCGEACYKAGLVDKARYVMQKGIAALEKKEHVSLLVRFAQMERLRGERERAEALFEQVIAVYPQRVDVCCAYVDMLLAFRDVEHVRQVMERMTSQKLPARKMKVLFKKWIEVEEKIGDQDQVESIRQRALEFIDKAKF
ncbi:unnamed protein product, partial [Brenthis ino]